MEQSESQEIECFKDQLQEIIKPYQQEQNRRQKKSEFLTKCVRSIEKNDFFQLDELLRSKQAKEILEDSDFESCDSIFDELRKFAEAQIDNYRLQFKGALLELAEEVGLPLKVDFPKFSVLKGIEGELNFATRSTAINQITLKSMDPKRIISTLVKLKRHLYDSPFDPQLFIDSLFHCYKEILKKEGHGMGNPVAIYQLYTDYVLSLQNKTFFQNMEKGKFKGCSIQEFAVNLWRFFESDVAAAEGEYRIKLNPGRGKSFWLIDHDGEKRQITNALFIKN
jgi:hypothetical protein